MVLSSKNLLVSTSSLLLGVEAFMSRRGSGLRDSTASTADELIEELYGEVQPSRPGPSAYHFRPTRSAVPLEYQSPAVESVMVDYQTPSVRGSFCDDENCYDDKQQPAMTTSTVDDKQFAVDAAIQKPEADAQEHARLAAEKVVIEELPMESQQLVVQQAGLLQNLNESGTVEEMGALIKGSKRILDSQPMKTALLSEQDRFTATMAMDLHDMATSLLDYRGGDPQLGVITEADVKAIQEETEAGTSGNTKVRKAPLPLRFLKGCVTVPVGFANRCISAACRRGSSAKGAQGAADKECQRTLENDTLESFPVPDKESEVGKMIEHHLKNMAELLKRKDVKIDAAESFTDSLPSSTPSSTPSSRFTYPWRMVKNTGFMKSISSHLSKTGNAQPSIAVQQSESLHRDGQPTQEMNAKLICNDGYCTATQERKDGDQTHSITTEGPTASMMNRNSVRDIMAQQPSLTATTSKAPEMQRKPSRLGYALSYANPLAYNYRWTRKAQNPLNTSTSVTIEESKS